MHIAIVDDEKIIRDQIQNLIKKKPANCFVETFSTGEELLAEGKRFDIVFLDIQMDGINGIETARALKAQQEEIVLIFITCIKDYVFEAFDVAAFHYLVKPVEEKKFSEVFRRAAREASKRKKQEKLFVTMGNRKIAVNCKDIIYIESRSRKAEIHTVNENIEIYASMNELERQLGESFYRCHRGYLINMEQVAEYDTDGVIFSNGEKIYLAKKKRGEFAKAYMWYRQNGGMFGA